MYWCIYDNEEKLECRLVPETLSRKYKFKSMLWTIVLGLFTPQNWPIRDNFAHNILFINSIVGLQHAHVSAMNT